MLISDIRPNNKNPRKIRDEQLLKLAQSISLFEKMMALRPIVVDEKGVILGGNMRYRALKHLKYTEIPDEWVKVASGLTEDERRRFIIEDNVGFGEWDFDMLRDEWDISELSEWGLEVPEFQELEANAEEDDYKIPDEIQTDIVLGDLIEIGAHRLMCGDSTDSDAVARLMNGENAEMLFTSPPYSDMREYNGNKDLSVGNIVNFISAFYQYSEYQVINLGLQRKDHDIVQYWDDYIRKAKEIGYKFLSWNVWAKQSAGSVGNQSAFIPISHEWIFVFGKKFKDINRTCERKTEIKDKRTRRSNRNADGTMKYTSIGRQEDRKEMESVLYMNTELGKIRKSHPATFPVELPSEYIKAITNENDLIAEPFCGSGTTMVAAHQLKRKCYGMELDPKYCQVIVDRMLKLDPGIEVKRNGDKYEI